MNHLSALRAGSLLPPAFAAAVCVSVVSAQQQPRFRSSVDVIAVDVQVVDKDGFPVRPLDPQAFQVSINNQRRKVASAQFIRHAWTDLPVAGATLKAPPPMAGETVPGGGRTFIVAVDNG